MRDVSRILPEKTVKDLDQCLETLCIRQLTKRDALRDVSLNPTDNDLVVEVVVASREVQVAEK